MICIIHDVQYGTYAECSVHMDSIKAEVLTLSVRLCSNPGLGDYKTVQSGPQGNL